MPRATTLTAGQTVAVQHGRESLEGVVAAVGDHPVFGPYADVEVAGELRRFIAARVAPADKRTGRQPAKESGPVRKSGNSGAGLRGRQAAGRGGAL